MRHAHDPPDRPRLTGDVLSVHRVRELVDGITLRLYTTPVEDTFWIADALWQIFPGEMKRADFATLTTLGLPPKGLYYADATVLRNIVRCPNFLSHINRLPPERSSLISAYHLYRQCEKERATERFTHLIASRTITPDTDRETIRELCRNHGKTIEQLREEAIEAINANPPYRGGGNRIIHGSFEILDHLVEDESADMVFLDPPWKRQYVHLYGAAAEQAERKLKPGGLLLAYSSNDHPLEVGNLIAEHLTFRHYFFVRYSRRLPLRHETEIAEAGQILYLFYKPPKVKLWQIPFRTIDGTPDKRYHPWGQGEAEIKYYLCHLLRPGSLLLDPFCGGGTLAVVCRALGIRSISTEIDAQYADRAQRRLGSLGSVGTATAP